MTARTHDMFAFASLVTVAVYYPPTSLNTITLFASVVGNIIGSLLPDMDQACNRLWDLLPAGNFLGRIFRRIFISHRTLSHSLLGLFLISHILWWLLHRLINPNFVDINILYVSVMVGFISHLIADALTKEGLPLLFPLKLKFGFPPISTLRITTGKWIENLVVLPGVT